MVNCKNFYEIRYLINQYGNTTISTYQKGVMATRLGEGGEKSKPDIKEKKI